MTTNKYIIKRKPYKGKIHNYVTLNGLRLSTESDGYVSDEELIEMFKKQTKTK